MQLVLMVLLIVGVTIYVAFYGLTFSQEKWKQIGQYIVYSSGKDLMQADVFDFCPFEPLDPWHESVMEFVDVKYGFDTCNSKKMYEPITMLKDKQVFLNSSYSDYNCTGRCLFYVDDHRYKVSDFVPIEGYIFHCDFIETLCRKEEEVRHFVHMQIEKKRSRLNNSQITQETNPDVHLLVLDSVASTQLIRALPRTVNFLLHGLSAVEFRKFNKVGDNSRPNAFPALLGKTTEEVERNVMNLNTIAADLSYDEFCYKYLDEEAYIPLEYYNTGYMTYDAEDCGTSVLRYPDCKGLENDVLDHYYRAFHQRLVKDKNLSKILYDGQCRRTLDYMLDYLSLFLDAYKDKDAFYISQPKFSFFWNLDIAHDDSQLLYNADLAFYNFLTKNKNELSKSFIFFFGDHGPRYGKVSCTELTLPRVHLMREFLKILPLGCYCATEAAIKSDSVNSIFINEEASTWLGEKERNNPFLYVVVPQSLRKTLLYQKLLQNSEELVTPHDLYATFLDILHFQPATNFTDASFKRFDPPARGSSLLRAFEPGKPRNCKTLPIPFQYCICQFVRKTVTDNSTLSKLGNFVASQLQLYLDSHNVTKECERIKLSWVQALQYVTTGPNVDQVPLSPTIVFDVTFEVVRPAKGKFMIPVRKEGEQLQLAGERFSRLDKYGKSGDCMKNDELKPVCTCKHERTIF